MTAAASVIALHGVVEAYWTLRLVVVVGHGSRSLAAAVALVLLAEPKRQRS